MNFADDFSDIFADIEDVRAPLHLRHRLDEIVFLTLCGVLAGCNNWSDISQYGRDKLTFLQEYLPYLNGTASHMTLCRFYRAVSAEALQACFLSFMRRLLPHATDRLIAIDGKVLRGSHDTDKDPLHLVSAFACEARLVLAQVSTDAKSNEITAIPQLLDLLDLRGATVTIDAAGCQTKIAGKIIAKNADYVLALKGNQGTLHNSAKELFNTAKTFADSYEESAKGHGRTETRRCDILSAEDTAFLLKTKEFPHVKSVVRITATRTIKEKTTAEKRYYLSSITSDAKRLEAAVRGHWAIENSLHWVLDMTFGEDTSRVRKDNAPLAAAVLKHIALNLLRAAKKKGESIAKLRKSAGWNDDTMRRIIN